MPKTFCSSFSFSFSLNLGRLNFGRPKRKTASPTNFLPLPLSTIHSIYPFSLPFFHSSQNHSNHTYSYFLFENSTLNCYNWAMAKFPWRSACRSFTRDLSFVRLSRLLKHWLRPLFSPAGSHCLFLFFF